MNAISWQPLLIGYLFGSIPSAYLVSRLVYGVDIFKCGSCNMGATNVYRVLGVKPFAATLVCDITKGFIAVVIAVSYFATSTTAAFVALSAGAAAILGHTFSVWVHFKGGKGVATAFGVFLALAPKSSVATIMVFITALLATNFVSISSIAAAGSLPFFILAFEEGGAEWQNSLFTFALLAAVFVIFKHKANIKRLWKGQENSLASSKETPSENQLHRKLELSK